MNTYRQSLPPSKLEFKVLIHREQDPGGSAVYIAQCLNYDLVAQGETVSDVLNSLERLIKTQIDVSIDEGVEPFSDFDPAPPELWEQYEKISDSEEKAFAFGPNIGPRTMKGTRPVSGVALMKLPV